jgi:hypothetical protein
MQATVIYSNNPFHPARDRKVVHVKRKRTIAKLAPETSAPFICLFNGKPLLRKDNGWNRTVTNNDVVCFITVVQGGGGGGSNPLKMILAIAVAIYAPQLSVGILGSAAATTTLGGLTFAGSLLTAGISFAGNALINALIRDPVPSLSNRSISAIQAASPTYNLSGQGNQARIGQSIPVMYGRNMIYMDFAAQPYTEFAGNDQYLYQLFVVGQGEYEIEQIRLEDSIIENDVIQDGEIHESTGNFEDIEYQVCYNQDITLFPQNVNNSVEVAGQESIDKDVFIGAFVANAAGTFATALGFDVVLPRGLYYANDSGGLDTVTVSFRGQYREIDDNGVAVGAGTWIDAFNTSVSLRTTTPQRLSYRVAVPAGRYECRFTRTNDKQTDTRFGNDVNWGSLRAYLATNQNYGNITMLAMRLKASNQLNQQSSRRINVVCTRKLSTYDGNAWTNAVVTRNPAWAFADIITASYGMNLPLNRIDADQLFQLSVTCQNRNDTFDAIYDGQQPAWEGLTQAARVCRSMPYIQGGNVYITRDEPQSAPVALFSMRNIAKNSLNISYLLPSEETADAIDVEYWDNGLFQQRTVRAALPDSTESTVVVRQLFGCSSREQAYREGMYMAAANRYRRRIVTFSTEMEGFIPTVGDLIAIQHDMPQWGQGGEILDYDPSTLIVTLSEKTQGLSGGKPLLTEILLSLLTEDDEQIITELLEPSETYYIAFRKRDGSATDSYEITEFISENEVRISEQPIISLDIGNDRERTYYALGEANREYIEAKVLEVKPRALEKVEISAVIDSDFVYTADTGVAPTASAWQLQNRIVRPRLSGLIVRSDPADPNIMLLSWQPSPTAERYLIEVSDSGLGWTRIAETSSPNFTTNALYGNRTFIRVAPVGLTRGSFVTIDYSSGADFMWDADDTTLMWNVDDSVRMWTY